MKNTTAKLFLVILIVLGSSGCSYQESLAPNENDPYEKSIDHSIALMKTWIK